MSVSTNSSVSGILNLTAAQVALLEPQYVVTASGDTSGVDDAAAINAAVALAVAAGVPSVVRFAAGQYYLSAPIKLTNATAVVLAGDNGSARLKLADNMDAAVPGDMVNLIELSGCTRCGIVGLSLDGNYQQQNMANLAMSFGDAAQGGSGNRRDPISIRYTGAGSACSMVISGSTLTTTVTGGPGSENLNIDLTAAGYDTIAELVEYIHAFGGTAGATYSCTIIHDSFGDQKSARLYGRTYADIKTSTTGVDFANASNAATHEIYGNCIYLINSNECEVVGCDLSNAPHMGVLITKNSSRNRIINNTGQLNNWRACEIWPNEGTDSSHNLIAGNQFKNSYHDSIVVEFPGTFRNSIVGNTILLDDLAFNSGMHEGIVVYDSVGNVVQGNTLEGCGITVQHGACHYNVIQGNTVDAQDRSALPYRTRGVHIRAGIGNVVEGNSLHDPYYDTIRVEASASKTVIKNNVLTLNNNAPRYPIFVEASSAQTIIGDNVLDGNTNGINDLGTRTILNGVGQNGSNDPASAGNWNGNGVEGVIVQWDNGAGKKRLSQYSGGAWINYYLEP
jgi:parallel beta-helix repeat protein